MKNVIVKCLSLLLLLLAGCSTVKNTRSDVELFSRSELAGHIRVDSVVLRDSVFIRERSDTVYHTRYRTIYKERLRVDTVVHCDTLYRDREIVVERECQAGSGNLRVLRLASVALLLFLLWRSGLWRLLWNLMLKGIQLCKKVFRLKV